MKCILLTNQQEQNAAVNMNIKISELETAFKNISYALYNICTLSTLIVIIYRLS